jgi:tetratricopeptide (TPR) repeat protein
VPHLSEIQKKYQGKVNVIGVNIWEQQGPNDTAQFQRIEKYIADMGDKMTYTIAADSNKGEIAKAWMEPSEAGGIPTAFIVGKDGTVMWIGHPMVGMDTAIDQILAGSYDLAAATKKDAERRSAIKARRLVMPPIQAAVQAKDFAKAVQLIDEAVANNPALVSSLGVAKFNFLLQTDEAKAFAWADELAQGPLKDNPNALNTLAWTIVDDESKLKKPDYAVAVRIAERGVALLKENDPFAPFILDTLGYALFKDGKLDRAIEVQTRAVKAAEALPNLEPATRKEISDRLEMFKKKKAGG